MTMRADIRIYACDEGMMNCFTCVGRERCTHYRYPSTEEEFRRATVMPPEQDNFFGFTVEEEPKKEYRPYKKYPKSLEDCIKELQSCAGLVTYAEIESLLTWSAAYLKDYLKSNEK